MNKIILTIIAILIFISGFILGIYNQSIQPEIAERLEKMKENIIPDMLEELREELNETQYCEVLQELECELRQQENYVKADMTKEYAPKVLIQ